LIAIQKVAVTDIPVIEGIAIACDLAPWTASDYVNELARSDSMFYRATQASACLGFILARIIPAVSAETGKDAEIYNIGVLPDKQGRGIGSILMNALLDECRKRWVDVVWLEVRSSNSRAIDFYSKHGFQVVSVRRAFYRDPVEDAIVMRSSLYKSPQTEA
jgi:[ribosomal protein S18]-alanine N-acetyltransferase